MPLAIRWDEPPHRSFELTQRLIATILSELGSELPVFGPGEFQVYEQRRDLFRHSDLPALLEQSGVAVERAVVLRTRVERRVTATSSSLQDGQGRARGGAGAAETTYAAFLEVEEPSTEQLLFEASHSTTVDPFQRLPEDSADPSPALTELLETLARASASALRELRAPDAAAPRPAPYKLAITAAMAAAYTGDAGPALELSLRSLSIVEAELLLEDRVRFLNPTLDASLVRALAKAPAGVYVLEAPGSAPLRPGDVVLRVNDRPALPQAFVRLARYESPVRLTVQRPTGERLEVTMPF